MAWTKEIYDEEQTNTRRIEIIEYICSNPYATQKEIDEKFGVSQRYISSVKAKAGIKIGRKIAKRGAGESKRMISFAVDQETHEFFSQFNERSAVLRRILESWMIQYKAKHKAK